MNEFVTKQTDDKIPKGTESTMQISDQKTDNKIQKLKKNMIQWALILYTDVD